MTCFFKYFFTIVLVALTACNDGKTLTDEPDPPPRPQQPDPPPEEDPSPRVFFAPPMFGGASTDVPVFAGQTAYLWPVVEGGETPQTYAWTVDGRPVEETGERLAFAPPAPGSYTVEATVAFAGQTKSVAIRVICHGDEAAGYRPTTAGSSPLGTTVHEYIPAPGQFINETLSGFTGNETTPEAAAAYAAERLEQRRYVSLGGFGGYLTVGFDHSIANKGAAKGYDLAIEGNPIAEKSSEPGVVWVMQDVNGNGRPDDVWYELKGSETGRPQTDARYAVTYGRPTRPSIGVPWRDNRGATGQIEYLAAFHQQEYYYPRWITPDLYTLRGTRVSPPIAQQGADWVISPLAWGYADNLGQDASPDATTFARFRIADAIHPDGTPARLAYIDFVKVQSGVNAQAGWLGEVSTEVFSVRDLNF